jgi:hypothetical protein
MTLDQVDTLAQMLASNLPKMVLEKAAGKPAFQPANRAQLYLEKDDVKNLLIPGLRAMKLID